MTKNLKPASDLKLACMAIAASFAASGAGLAAPLPADTPASSPTAMSCAEGPGYQCSGASIIRTENKVSLTNSGVQVYGKSTSDAASPISSVTSATGFAPATGGTAEIRLAKDANGSVANPLLLLSNLGISWDAKNERPPIMEVFLPTAGRSVLAANGTVTSAPLPDSSDLNFYDFASKGPAATQANYANNRYFPRTGNPPRCSSDTPAAACPTAETAGAQSKAGDWRTGGSLPDETSATRLHEDGDVHAGNGLPGPNNTPTVLPNGSGIGVPFPGSKGYRSLGNYSYQYANLAKWVTQDGVNITEWTSSGTEHNQNRRGIVAFGDVTPSASVPATGTASYVGPARGWYVRNATEEPTPFLADTTMSVDFATRQVTITMNNARSDDAAASPMPLSLGAVVGMGAPGTNVANYLNGPVSAGALTGGIGGRYFGPVAAAGAIGAAGSGPAEAGAAFSLSNPNTGEALIGGFIARKQ